MSENFKSKISEFFSLDELFQKITKTSNIDNIDPEVVLFRSGNNKKKMNAINSYTDTDNPVRQQLISFIKLLNLKPEDVRFSLSHSHQYTIGNGIRHNNLYKSFQILNTRDGNEFTGYYFDYIDDVETREIDRISSGIPKDTMFYFGTKENKTDMIFTPKPIEETNTQYLAYHPEHNTNNKGGRKFTGFIVNNNDGASYNTSKGYKCPTGYKNKQVVYVGSDRWFDYKKTWKNRKDFLTCVNKINNEKNSGKADLGCYEDDYTSRLKEHILRVNNHKFQIFNKNLEDAKDELNKIQQKGSETQIYNYKK